MKPFDRTVNLLGVFVPFIALVALAVRDDWESRMLRTATWSPLF